MTASRADTPQATRALGVVGILGGLVLLAAFVVDIQPGLNTVRLILFNAGAIAIAIATYGRHAAASRWLALVATIPIVAANACSIAWTLFDAGQERPFAGVFGLVGIALNGLAWGLLGTEIASGYRIRRWGQGAGVPRRAG